MKKKLAIIGTIALLGVGGFTMFNLNNPDWRANSIFATAKDKQLAWLKEHEEEIVKWVHSRYPKVETIQFDWNSLEVGPVSNGVANIGYNLSVYGVFNDNPKTVIIVDFLMEKKDDIPSLSRIRMNQPPMIRRGKGIYNYE
jgi:lipoprotein